jgi:exopolyphosphatase/guanosine-5'-triphosphate,3'-diphosphate pyrophosphatase
MGLSAVIDLGTNTFRLLVAEIHPNGFTTVFSENQIARLGEGFSEEKSFRPQAMERAMGILRAFKEILDRYTINQLTVVGTSAFREAKNRQAFLLSIKEQTGFDVEVITGVEEARLTFLGANLAFPNRVGPMVLIDIGGGSTELIIAEGGAPSKMVSTPLGVVALTERHLRKTPTTHEVCNAVKCEVAMTLREIVPASPQNAFFSGTAGTLTTLAAMDQQMVIYDPDKINGYCLSKKAIEAILHQLLPLSMEERCRLPGLERGREDVIVAGILILITLMELYHYDQVYVSDYGLREGVLMDRYRKSSFTPKSSD